MGFRPALSRRRAPALLAGCAFPECWRGVSAGSIFSVKRVSSAVRPRFSPALGRVLRGRVLGWYEAGARREPRPGGNRLGPSRGWDGGRLPQRPGWRTRPLREPDCQRGEFRRGLARLKGTV